MTVAHFQQAASRLERLPSFGIVERFHESIAMLARQLTPVFAELVLAPRRENASRGRQTSVTERLHGIRDETGDRRYQRLVAANEVDMELWSLGWRIFDKRVSNAVPAMHR